MLYYYIIKSLHYYIINYTLVLDIITLLYCYIIRSSDH